MGNYKINGPMCVATNASPIDPGTMSRVRSTPQTIVGITGQEPQPTKSLTALDSPVSQALLGGLSESEYKAAAITLICEVAVIKAVVLTELGISDPFDDLGRPTILFERHRFSALTHGKFDKTDPDISNPVRGGYGKFSEQYPKLIRAMALDDMAAPMACSWGAFQIMGENFKQAGHTTISEFVTAMKASVRN